MKGIPGAFVRIDIFPQLRGATVVEDILCWATLVARWRIDRNSTVKDAIEYYDKLKDGCDSCLYEPACTASIINR